MDSNVNAPDGSERQNGDFYKGDGPRIFICV